MEFAGNSCQKTVSQQVYFENLIGFVIIDQATPHSIRQNDVLIS
jgi:hypothetical protein